MMDCMKYDTFFAADVGNSRIKIGRFDFTPDCEGTPKNELAITRPTLPLPASTLQLGMLDAADRGALETRLREWIMQSGPSDQRLAWYVASVNRAHAAWLEETVAPLSREFRRLAHHDMPLEVRVDAPDRVGLDRLAGAVAANELRERDRAAIVIDLGTAITVDFVSADGAFEGGAILPGIAMAARALESQTDALPRSPLADLALPPDPVGKSTLAAIESGLLWGAVGAIRELAVRMTAACERPPHVFLTGGTSPSVVPLLQSGRMSVVHVPELVLGGIAIIAQRDRDSQYAGAGGPRSAEPPVHVAGGSPDGSTPATQP
jgi:type III pantothenate kinase